MMSASESHVSDEDWEETGEEERQMREERRREAAPNPRESRSRPDESLEMRGSRPDDSLRRQERRGYGSSQYGSRLHHRRSSNASGRSNGETLRLGHSVSEPRTSYSTTTPLGSKTQGSSVLPSSTENEAYEMIPPTAEQSLQPIYHVNYNATLERPESNEELRSQQSSMFRSRKSVSGTHSKTASVINSAKPQKARAPISGGSLLSDTLLAELKELDDDPRHDWIFQWLLFCVLTWSIALAVISSLTMTYDPPHMPEDEAIRKRNQQSHPCDDIECFNHGDCVAWPDGSWSCECEPGYIGRYCQDSVAEITYCHSSPCQNNGVCKELLLGYQCSCPTGTHGNNCELDFDDCLVNPCYFGKCINLIGGFVCICDTQGQEYDPNIRDPLCKTDKQTCADKPCRNGSSCSSVGIGYREHIIYQVQQNTVEKITLKMKYECTCPPDWVGFNCKLEDQCKGVDCGHGTCRTLTRALGDLNGDKRFCECRENDQTKEPDFIGEMCLGRTHCSSLNCPKFECRNHTTVQVPNLVAPQCRSGTCQPFSQIDRPKDVKYCYKSTSCEKTSQSLIPNCVFEIHQYDAEVDGRQVKIPLRCETVADCDRDPPIRTSKDGLPDNLDPLKCKSFNLYDFIIEQLEHGHYFGKNGESLLNKRYTIPSRTRIDMLGNPSKVAIGAKFPALQNQSLTDFDFVCNRYGTVEENTKKKTEIEMAYGVFSGISSDLERSAPKRRSRQHNLKINVGGVDTTCSSWVGLKMLVDYKPSDLDFPSRLEMMSYIQILNGRRTNPRQFLKIPSDDPKDNRTNVPCIKYLTEVQWERDEALRPLFEDLKCIFECVRHAPCKGTCDDCLACAKKEDSNFAWKTFNNDACKQEIDPKDRSRCCS